MSWPFWILADTTRQAEVPRPSVGQVVARRAVFSGPPHTNTYRAFSGPRTALRSRPHSSVLRVEVPVLANSATDDKTPGRDVQRERTDGRRTGLTLTPQGLPAGVAAIHLDIELT